MNKLIKLDKKVFNDVKKIHSPGLTWIMKRSSNLGTFGTVWLAIATIFLVVPDYRDTGFNFLVALLVGNISGEVIIKHIVRRVRPCECLEEEELLVDKPRFYSFPSGHTTASFAFLTVTVLRCNLLMIIIISILAVLISFSRIYLRVHYLSDVIGGVILGMLSGVFTYFFCDEIIRAVTVFVTWVVSLF